MCVCWRMNRTPIGALRALVLVGSTDPLRVGQRCSGLAVESIAYPRRRSLNADMSHSPDSPIPLRTDAGDGSRTLRLQLASAAPPDAVVDGGWWPWSTDLVVELPA